MIAGVRIFCPVETTLHSTAYEALRAENEALRARLRASEEQARAYREKLALVEHELYGLKRLIFGIKRERFVPVTDGLPVFEAEQKGPRAGERLPGGEGPSPKRAAKKKPMRQVLPAHLPREVIVIEPEVDTSHLKKIGEEITETLAYRPAQLVVIRRVRPKYVDPRNEQRGVIIAALPTRAIEKGMAEPSLLAHVVIEKYVDHLPLYRQIQRFKREGITLSASTLGDWVASSAELLAPLYEALKQEALSGGYIQADETPIAVQDEQTKGKTHRGYYWVYHAPLRSLVVMDYQQGRGRDGPKDMLDGYQGALQSDGYAVYDSYDGRPGMTSYNCWAHARRYFYEALGNAPDWAAHVLEEIGRLYEVERLLREREASPESRCQLRQGQAVPVLARLKMYLEAHPGLPKSPWGQAVAYSLARWAKLIRYTEDGRIEIDNNLVENAIRPIALGRRNYLFSGSHEAAQRAAVIYSLLATCKKHEVNPETWLGDVLGRIASYPMKRVHELLPHHWKNSKG